MKINKESPLFVDWCAAVDIFYSNIKKRYLDPVDKLRNLPDSELAILILDCTLIEQLQQFREGRTKPYFTCLHTCYVNFLLNTTFSKYFTKAAALRFSKVRNEAIHSGNIIKAKRQLAGRVLTVTSFHDQMVRVIDEYVIELKTGNDEALKRNFLRKMLDMGWFENKEIKRKNYWLGLVSYLKNLKGVLHERLARRATS